MGTYLCPQGTCHWQVEVKSHIHSVLNVTANAHFECDPIVGMDVPQAMEMSCRDHGKDCGFLRNVSL